MKRMISLKIGVIMTFTFLEDEVVATLAMVAEVPIQVSQRSSQHLCRPTPDMKCCFSDFKFYQENDKHLNEDNIPGKHAGEVSIAVCTLHFLSLNLLC